MRIEQQQIDNLNIQLTLNMSNEDYASIEKKKLNDRRRTAEIKGFRKGMAPMSLIQRFYGEQALLEAVNEVISTELNNFIKENNLELIGEPLSSEDHPEIDWKSGNDFVFKFDIAKKPELNIEVSEADKLAYYNITVTDQAKAELKENMLKQVGSLQDTDTAKANDFVIVDFTNETREQKSAYVAIDKVAESSRQLFLDAKVGDSFELNVTEAFADEVDRAYMLGVKKEELATLNPVFKVEIKQIKTFVSAEENQTTYDKLFGIEAVKSPEEFNKAIEDRLVSNYKEEADYKLSKDIKQYFLTKSNIDLPEAFLKRWLLHINEGKFTMEDIEKDFSSFLDDFRWELIRNFMMKKYNLELKREDLVEAAKSLASYQYAMYGMSNVPEDMLNQFAERMLEDERQARALYDQVVDKMVVEALRKDIKLDEKEITIDKFRELA